ncbi:MAG: hypothetical protein WBC85_08960 [Planktotalea sp.]|uniref:hypothetical protein n=1 Tax=Planktotalea sp. TaxID=2029877 RepID=UPI003C76A58D
MLLVVFLCLMAAQAFAGAWPRGKGNAFISSSASLTWPKGRAFEYPDIYGSGYAEYGLSQRVTLGLDLGSSDATRQSRLKAIGFLRYTLSDPNARHQFAMDIGAGKHLGENVIRLGASYGTGIQLFSRPGWVAFDAHTLINPNMKTATSSVDATMGLNLEHGKLIGLLSAHVPSNGARTYTFTPSYVRKFGKSRHIELGVSFDLSGGPDPALKLGIWQEF